MKVPYSERYVDPLPGESGLQRFFEPMILVRAIGPSRAYLIRGYLDTGASITILPRGYMSQLGIEQSERADLRTAGGGLGVRIATVDLELNLGRRRIRWSARVGFAPRDDNFALYGHGGFLEHFTTAFDGPRREFTIRPTGVFPDPIFDDE